MIVRWTVLFVVTALLVPGALGAPRKGARRPKPHGSTSAADVDAPPSTETVAAFNAARDGRLRSQPFDEWRTSLAAPERADAHNESASAEEADALFHRCLDAQAFAFSKRVAEYRPPPLADVAAAVRRELEARSARVVVVVFWGRARYVSMLWRYLERNLRGRGGVVDQVLLVVKNRDTNASAADAHAMLKRFQERNPDAVAEVPFCRNAYGCAFDEIMVDPQVVYVKLDDDVIFILDGSFEHLVYQTLFNSNYTFFSGSVVNNPHSVAVHQFAGAYPLQSYHWKSLGSTAFPLASPRGASRIYYGKNLNDRAGSQAHEAFIVNAAAGRLHVYQFDVWDMHQCRCGLPQEGLNMCLSGFYRWSINAIAFARNVSAKFTRRIPRFDEPAISIGWPSRLQPHRAGIVGDSLFVHTQVWRGW
jgi:hypothetical protein